MEGGAEQPISDAVMLSREPIPLLLHLEQGEQLQGFLRDNLAVLDLMSCTIYLFISRTFSFIAANCAPRPRVAGDAPPAKVSRSSPSPLGKCHRNSRRRDTSRLGTETSGACMGSMRTRSVSLTSKEEGIHFLAGSETVCSAFLDWFVIFCKFPLVLSNLIILLQFCQNFCLIIWLFSLLMVHRYF